MRVLVTGATGFVGRWLTRELEAAGHEVVGAPSSNLLNITDAARVREFVHVTRPEAIAHLGGVSFGPDARRDPDTAFQVNVLGTVAVLDAARRMHGPAPSVLIAGSSEVYGRPEPGDLPLTESAATFPVGPYGLSKLAQEAVAVGAGCVSDLPVVVTRSFNHTGPGQRPDFVVPALARRVVAVERGLEPVLRTGNVDVRRDFTDVRDVVIAYRLLLEASVGGRLGSRPVVVNVASGRSVAIRAIVEQLCAIAGCEPRIAVDESLVRADDPPEIRGDASLLGRLTGWEPKIALNQTLADVLREATSSAE